MNDEDLVRRFTAGDNGAFEVLLMRHKDRVYTYIFNMVHEESVADDIFQETFLKVITTLKQGRYYDAGNRFVGWLMRIAHNKTIDYYRQLAAEKEVCDSSAFDSIEKEEALHDVEMLIDILPMDQRRIVMMRYYQDLSFKEIAEIEGISINTALGRMRYALINLRKNVEKYDLVRDLEKVFD